MCRQYRKESDHIIDSIDHSSVLGLEPRALLPRSPRVDSSGLISIQTLIEFRIIDISVLFTQYSPPEAFCGSGRRMKPASPRASREEPYRSLSSTSSVQKEGVSRGRLIRTRRKEASLTTYAMTWKSGSLPILKSSLKQARLESKSCQAHLR